MKAGIAIDDWKQSIFEKALTEAGYIFERGRTITAGSLVLYVIIEDVPGAAEKLAMVVQEANTAAARSKLH